MCPSTDGYLTDTEINGIPMTYVQCGECSCKDGFTPKF